MKYTQYTVDAFSDRPMYGNPAAVIVTDEFPTDEQMQLIAGENNYSETAFIVKEKERYHLRWFTLAGEIDLCGHATLASAYTIFRFFEPNADRIVFSTVSGDLLIERKDSIFEMSLPAYPLQEIPVTDDMERAFGIRPIEAYLGRDLLCIMASESDVRNMMPDSELLKTLPGLLQNVTARGKEWDCVSRSFAPKTNVYEDPVCGSGHCHIFPYWAAKTGKTELIGFQASPRGGVLYCKIDGERAILGGQAALFAVSEIYTD